MMQLDALIKVILPGDREIGDTETRRLGDVKLRHKNVKKCEPYMATAMLIRVKWKNPQKREKEILLYGL